MRSPHHDKGPASIGRHVHEEREHLMHRVTRGAFTAVAAGSLATAAIALVPPAADATPGSGVTATILSKTTVGQTDYVLREITIQPGGTTGWHFHDGTLYAFVKAGTLTH